MIFDSFILIGVVVLMLLVGYVIVNTVITVYDIIKSTTDLRTRKKK